MSTDSTELTFVRCPSCRSLVPASQTRCRMCGASLEASGKSEETEKQAVKNSRVKQRTMSVQQGDVTQALTQAKESGYSEPEMPVENTPAEESTASPALTVDSSAHDIIGEDPIEVPQNDEVGKSTADPLGPYIEELPADSDPASHADDDLNDFDEDDYDFLDDDSDLDDFMDQAEDESPAHAEGIANGALAKPTGKEGHNQEESPHMSSPESELESKPLAAKTEMSDAPSPSKPAAPQVRVDNGPRKQTSGLSFGRGREDRGNDRKEFHRDDPRRPEHREERPQSRDKMEARPEHHKAERQHETHAGARPESKGPAKAANIGGRLFGWLVSYHTPDGVAVELREGKYFVSRTSLKTNDFVVDDDSVSTPHALINISLEKGFQVQDLMSERGVFIRRRQGDTYQKEDMATIQHGDWVRFGDVEFLVSLVAHVGMK